MEKGSENHGVNYSELSYLPPPDPYYVQQGLREKFIRKTKENPFVPIGVVFTTVVLAMGLWTMRSGSGRRSQILMRLRVGGQAFAIVAMLTGVYYKGKTGKSDQ
uniref:HIG1 domain-containing protein n=1 Tax=Arion vulgaris TaxID=1028688 RepID=A0A0B6XYV5_9EUPU